MLKADWMLLRRQLLPLISAVALFVALTSFLSLLKYQHFLNYDWDLGIAIQSLWSTTHGRLMYETADLSTSGLKSYLEVNTAYLGLLIAPFFRLDPSAEFLFVLQSVAVGASAFPLHKVCTKIGIEEPYATLLCVVYLFSYPMLSSILFDFHYEAFIPVEFFLFICLAMEERFVPASLVILLGGFTLEVFPFLSAAYGLVRLSEFRRSSAVSGSKIIVISAAVYILAVAIQRSVIYSVAGSLHPAHAAYFLVPGKLILPESALYWLLLLLSLCFLPVMKPRLLLLSVPWFVESVFLYSLFSQHLGNQYAFIAFPPLFIGFVHAFAWLRRSAGRLTWVALSIPLLLLSAFLSLSSRTATLLNPPYGYLIPIVALMLIALLSVIFLAIFLRKRPHGRVRLAILFLCSLLVLNLVLGPLNTENYNATTYAGYDTVFSGSNAFNAFSTIVSSIPSNATVIASNNLFPYIARDLNAYSILPPYSASRFPFLPFSNSTPPEYVLIDTDYYYLPPFLGPELFNTSAYGLKAFIFEYAYPGCIYLFELHYSGHTREFIVSAQHAVQYFDYRNLITGPSGKVARMDGSRFGYVIQSRYADRNTSVIYNTMWYGPYITLLPGNYTLLVNLSVSGNGSSPVLYMDSSALYSPFYYSVTVAKTGGWREVELNFTVQRPYFFTEFRGYLLYTAGMPDGSAVLNYMKLTYE